jgi:heme/copper-type cytochrome/quinol oxidase subunit 4
MMMNMGLPGFFLILMVVLLVVPFWMLLPKFGISKFVALLAIIPLGALILLWVIAFMEPKAPRNAMSEART